MIFSTPLGAPVNILKHKTLNDIPKAVSVVLHKPMKAVGVHTLISNRTVNNTSKRTKTKMTICVKKCRIKGIRHHLL